MSTLDNNNTLLREQLGKGDIEVFTTAAQTSKDFYAINFPVESTITTITIANSTGSGLNGITVPAGSTIFGRCTAITLGSGVCIGYVENDRDITA
tara:strand:- start:1383 stop:1667 length:285 start_codon:yes stop_codon:yes gene_type:complete